MKIFYVRVYPFRVSRFFVRQAWQKADLLARAGVFRVSDRGKLPLSDFCKFEFTGVCGSDMG